MTITFHTGDVLECLAKLPDASVDCCVTSPPYWSLRDYGVEGQIGLERTPEEYVEKLTKVFREVRRVLKKEGTLWLNLGDTYSATRWSSGGGQPMNKNRDTHRSGNPERVTRLPDKNLVGIPWRTAFALQADGWILRQDIIWSKPSCMPESVKDRCTRSHEYIFLLTKSPRYYFDAGAIREAQAPASAERTKYPWRGRTDDGSGGARTGSTFRRQAETGEKIGTIPKDGYRNKRSVWTIPPRPFKEAHFAVFPPEIPELCIAAGCPKGGTVLDCFAGAGTTGLVADRLQRDAIMIELNESYVRMAVQRIAKEQGMFADMEAAE